RRWRPFASTVTVRRLRTGERRVTMVGHESMPHAGGGYRGFWWRRELVSAPRRSGRRWAPGRFSVKLGPARCELGRRGGVSRAPRLWTRGRRHAYRRPLRRCLGLAA